MAWGAVMRPMTLPDKARRTRFLRPFGRPISTKKVKTLNIVSDFHL